MPLMLVLSGFSSCREGQVNVERNGERERWRVLRCDIEIYTTVSPLELETSRGELFPIKEVGAA